MKNLSRLRVKRLIAGTLVLLAVSFAIVWMLGRAQIASQYPHETITLRIWTYGEDIPALRRIADDYQKRHANVTVKIEPQNEANYGAALDAARGVGFAPDIYLVRDVSADKPHLAPAPERLVRADRVRRDMIPAVGESLVWGNSVYALSLEADNLALVYRRSMLSAASLKPPQTWTELLAAAKKLTQKNGLSLQRSGLALGTPLTDPSTSALQTLMVQNGATMLAPDGSHFTFADPEQGSGYFPGPKALDFFTSFANPQKESYSWNDSLGDPVAAFAAGKIAMLIAPYSRAAALGEGTGKDLGTSPFPVIQTGKTRNQALLRPYGVDSGSRNIFAAWDFLRFATGERELGIYLEKSGRLSPRLDLARPEIRDARRGAWASQLSSSHSWRYAGAPETVNALQAAVAAVVTNKATSKQALDTATQALAPLLGRK